MVESTDTMPTSRVLFEPWSLGDAIIAASILPHLDRESALACSPRWHNLIQSALKEQVHDRLIAVDLDYTSRGRQSIFQSVSKLLPAPGAVREVLSIRGDLRDYLSARKIFPAARIRMNGWTIFAARRSSLIDIPFSSGIRPVANRYEAWAKLNSVPFANVKDFYKIRRAEAPRSMKIAIHVGAQWRSKQYPDVSTLARELADKSYQVILLAGPQDRLPPQIEESQVKRLINQPLINELLSSEYVITNDSGPMHLAALLGCRLLAISRTSNISEWIPPGAKCVTSPQMPRGYRPDPRYITDEILSGWPASDEVIAKLLA